LGISGLKIWDEFDESWIENGKNCRIPLLLGQHDGAPGEHIPVHHSTLSGTTMHPGSTTVRPALCTETPFFYL